MTEGKRMLQEMLLASYLEIVPLNDSVVLNYKYNNSFHPTDTTTIRIVRINNEWLVDLKSVIKM